MKLWKSKRNQQNNNNNNNVSASNTSCVPGKSPTLPKSSDSKKIDSSTASSSTGTQFFSSFHSFYSILNQNLWYFSIWYELNGIINHITLRLSILRLKCMHLLWFAFVQIIKPINSQLLCFLLLFEYPILDRNFSYIVMLISSFNNNNICWPKFISFIALADERRCRKHNGNTAMHKSLNKNEKNRKIHFNVAVQMMPKVKMINFNGHTHWLSHPTSWVWTSA